MHKFIHEQVASTMLNGPSNNKINEKEILVHSILVRSVVYHLVSVLWWEELRNSGEQPLKFKSVKCPKLSFQYAIVVKCPSAGECKCVTHFRSLKEIRD